MKLGGNSSFRTRAVSSLVAAAHSPQNGERAPAVEQRGLQAGVHTQS